MGKEMNQDMIERCRKDIEDLEKKEERKAERERRRYWQDLNTKMGHETEGY